MKGNLNWKTYSCGTVEAGYGKSYHMISKNFCCWEIYSSSNCQRNLYRSKKNMNIFVTFAETIRETETAIKKI